ncbi:peptidase inhibitor family I36 protein [Nonomuraea sp. NPDC004580]|uniref:peptidase inhibitor family I36 protein n=1 Tax=Nonomuraea sp. NPDC004580 TaxID=3154552 RepID=UPI0033B0CA6D
MSHTTITGTGRARRTLVRAGAVIAAGVVVAGALNAAPAHAAANAARINAYLAAIPYGTKISNNEIAWEGGSVRLLLSATQASCPRGWYCVYEHRNWRGAMAKWRSSPSKCKKFTFTRYWRDKISSFWARGSCERNNYFLKDEKKWQPDPFQLFEGKKAWVRFNDRYDYAAKGL